GGVIPKHPGGLNPPNPPMGGLRSSGAGIKFRIEHETGAGFKITPGTCLPERQRRQGFSGK
ncbi:MAG TPA: hypothetical protein PK106_09120, partial [Bacteroidales bacterium]|nr:hypothetical protein [Bacteroidales bacterium]